MQTSKCAKLHGRIREPKLIQLSHRVEWHSGRVVRDVTGKIRRGQTRQGLFEATISSVNFILGAVGAAY